MKYKSIHNPFSIVRMFEEEIANYCGAPFAIVLDSCTNAIFLCCKYLSVETVTIPAKTYLSVPQSIINAGGNVEFENISWEGSYQLKPYEIYDSALRFTAGMYVKGSFTCLSFHYKKHLPIGKGGAILTDNVLAADWFKKSRYEGRSEISYWEDQIDMVGYNMYMTPSEAAIGLSLMQNIALNNEDIQEDGGYRDLRDFTNFRRL